MAEVKIDNGYVEVYEMGALRCRIQGGAYVTESDVAVADGEIRVKGGGSTMVYDMQGRPLRSE